MILTSTACGTQTEKSDAATPSAAPTSIGLHADPAQAAWTPAALPGGAATVIALNPETDRSLDVLSRPSANLPPSGRALFTVGNAFFTQPWVSAPASTTARDGLGPLFNATACQDCHVRDGRGHPPSGPDEPLRAAVVRISTPEGGAHPVYGRQVQTLALPGLLPEAQVAVHWQTLTRTLPDDTTVELRKPQIQLSDWSDGPPGPLHAGLRVAPAMSGLGLLEAIPARDIHAYAAEQARRWPAQAGLPAEVDTAGADRSPSTEPERLGRFGWTAARASVRTQVLAAFAEDLGITSDPFPQDACTAAQRRCRAYPDGGQPELQAAIADAVVHYARHLALPARRDAERAEVQAGSELFRRIGCAVCHRPQWTTGPYPEAPELAGQTIWPYTDLLLHDLGPELDDGVAEAHTRSGLWRTAPLWGLQHAQWVGGPQAGFLHDGRARTLTEAILWHGGQAEEARDAWAALPAEQRRLVLRFLASL